MAGVEAGECSEVDRDVRDARGMGLTPAKRCTQIGSKFGGALLACTFGAGFPADPRALSVEPGSKGGGGGASISVGGNKADLGGIDGSSINGEPVWIVSLQLGATGWGTVCPIWDIGVLGKGGTHWAYS